MSNEFFFWKIGENKCHTNIYIHSSTEDQSCNYIPKFKKKMEKRIKKHRHVDFEHSEKKVEKKKAQQTIMMHCMSQKNGFLKIITIIMTMIR